VPEALPVAVDVRMPEAVDDALRELPDETLYTIEERAKVAGIRC
jgi:hypothetical protein